VATVLIVDDEFGIAELLEAALTDEGHTVHTAANGKQGLAVIAEHNPDLIFLDVMMPVMDGPTMLGLLAREERMRAIPVVLMSSVPEETVKARCGGYAVFLRKPFRLQEVIVATTRLIAPEAEHGSA
jgi:CheY-like chemotaxis protein